MKGTAYNLSAPPPKCDTVMSRGNLYTKQPQF